MLAPARGRHFDEPALTCHSGCVANRFLGDFTYLRTMLEGPPIGHFGKTIKHADCSTCRICNTTFITLNGSPRAIKGSESLARIHPPFDRSMVLLHDVVQVGASPTAAPATQFPLLLQFGDYLRVGGVAIDVDDARARMT